MGGPITPPPPPKGSSLGIDVSELTSAAAFTCLRQKGYTFAVVRIYQSLGHVDANARQSIMNAKAGGMSVVDGYIFPCPKCGNPAGQVKAAISNVHGLGLGTVWLDIEGPQYWSSSPAQNVAFIHAMVAQAKSMGVRLGVYTSQSQWQPIAGDSSEFSDLPLWYAHYNNRHDFSDWTPFAGWTKPVTHQYTGMGGGMCGLSQDQDLNWSVYYG